MITITEASTIINENRPPRVVEQIALDQALGRYLAAGVMAVEPSPRYTNSAMDGFAVRWQDVAGIKDGPVNLAVIGESQAGIPFAGELAAGSAIRISTGAMLPDTADTVVRVEDTTDLGNQVLINKVSRQHQDVRFQGEEISTGDLLLPPGSGLFPPQIALLAAQGIDPVPVFARPRVALVITGTELVSGDQPAPHQIRDSNRVMLQSAVEQAGAVVVSAGWAGDEFDKTVQALGQATSEAGIVICSGGVSVGPHDHVRQAAAELGFKELFWRVRQKPGKPLYCGRLNDTLLFGLPGNPVSAFMCFIYYIQPLLSSLLGRDFSRPTLTAKAGCEITNRGNRTTLVGVQLSHGEDGGESFQPAAGQGSHMLTSIARADGFVIVPEQTTLPADSRQEVFLFPWR
jgi:molybdopterin molybdotransferase